MRAGVLLFLLGTLGTVLAAALGAAFNTGGVEGAADDVIAYTGKVFHTATAYHDDRVLLQVVALARDIGVNLLAVGQADTSNLAHSRIRLLRCGRVDTNTHTATLRARVQSGRFAGRFQRSAAFSY